MSILSGIIDFASGLGGAILGQVNNNRDRHFAMDVQNANIAMQRETNEFNRQLAEMSWQKELEQWNRENAYNDPSRQMERLKAAGLNPALVYGGSANTVAASSPSYATPNMVAPRIDASAIPKRSNALAEFVSGAYHNYLVDKELQTRDEFNRSQMDVSKAQVRLINSQAMLNDTKAKVIGFGNIDKFNDLSFDKLNKLLQNFDDRHELNRSQKDYIDSQTGVNQKKSAIMQDELENAPIKWGLVKAQTNLTKKQAFAASACAALYIQQAKTLKQQERLLGWKAKNEKLQYDERSYLNQKYGAADVEWKLGATRRELENTRLEIQNKLTKEFGFDEHQLQIDYFTKRIDSMSLDMLDKEEKMATRTIKDWFNFVTWPTQLGLDILKAF